MLRTSARGTVQVDGCICTTLLTPDSVFDLLLPPYQLILLARASQNFLSRPLSLSQSRGTFSQKNEMEYASP